MSPFSDMNWFSLNLQFSAIVTLLPVIPLMLKRMTSLLSLLLKLGFPVWGSPHVKNKQRKRFKEGGECAQIVKQLI